MILILLLHLSYLGFGVATLRLLFTGEQYPWCLRFSLGYFVGLFLHVLILKVAIIATVTSPVVSWLLFVIGLSGLFYEIIFVFKIKQESLQFPTISPSSLILNAGIVILMIPAIYLITTKLVAVPEISYDSSAFWYLKSKYFFYGEHFWTDAFFDARRVHPHPDYPLYMPVFIYEHYSILGIADDFMTKPGTWIYYFCGMVLFFMLTREWVGNPAALMIVALVLYMPLHGKLIEGSITTTYVDFPLSIMVLGTVGFFLRYFRNGKQIDIFAVMIFLCSAILQKREGSVWFIIALVFGIMGMWFYQKRSWNREYCWFAIPLLVFVSWYLVSINLPHPTELHTLFGIFVPLGFSVGILRNLRNGFCLVPGLMILGYLGVIFFVIILMSVQAGSIEYFVKRPGQLYYRLLLHIHLAGLFLATVMNSNKFISYFQINSSASRS